MEAIHITDILVWKIAVILHYSYCQMFYMEKEI